MSYFKSTSTVFSRNGWRFGFCDAPSAEDCIGTGKHGEDGTSNKCKLECVGCDEDEFTLDQIDGYLTYMFPEYTPSNQEEAQLVLRTIMCDSKVYMSTRVILP